MILTASAGGCNWLCDHLCVEWPPAPPQADRVTIIPSEVWASAGDQFQLVAYAWDQNGKRMPYAVDLEWSSSNPNVTVGDDGQVIVASSFVGKDDVTITTSVQGTEVSDEAVVHVFESDAEARAGPPPADVILYRHTVRASPNVALLRAIRGGGTTSEDIASFASLVTAGNVHSSNFLALFSVGREVRYNGFGTSPPWSTSAGDTDDEKPNAPTRPVTVKVNVFIAVRAEAERSRYPGHPEIQRNLFQLANNVASLQAKTDLLHAQALYDSNRTGISFEIDQHATFADTMGLYPASLRSVGECGVSAAPGWYKAQAINVYYVDYVPNASTARGMRCEPDKSGGLYDYSRGEVIYLSYYLRSQTTLAHELGHVLGLPHPDGMTDPEFNVMFDEAPELPSANARGLFTLGQAFWMNFFWDKVEKDGSWLINDANNDGRIRAGIPWIYWDCETAAECLSLNKDVP